MIYHLGFHMYPHKEKKATFTGTFTFHTDICLGVLQEVFLPKQQNIVSKCLGFWGVKFWGNYLTSHTRSLPAVHLQLYTHTKETKNKVTPYCSSLLS